MELTTVTNALRLMHTIGGNAVQVSLGSAGDRSIVSIADDDARTALMIVQKCGFYLIIHGIIYLYKHSVQKIDNLKIAKNFIITGSLITILGLLSSLNSFINFFTYFYFGLNKRAMTQISSISGNTWRGLAPSAESIGEFFAFSVFLFVFLAIKKQIKLNFLYIGLLLINVIGLLRANNVAAILSLSLIHISEPTRPY